MQRWTFLRSALGALAPVALHAQTNAERPNLVFVIADDLGWNDIGYQNPQVRSPHVDRLLRAACA